MSKKAFIKVVENVKKRKNEYFVKNFDITESVELLLEEVKKDYEFKKQVSLQIGLNTCNETLEKQAKKCRKEISELKEQLADAEEPIDNLELQLREQYQLVDEKDEEIAKLEERLNHTPKYRPYERVFYINMNKHIIEDCVEEIRINHRDGIYYLLINDEYFEEDELFSTKEEAEQKIKELGIKVEDNCEAEQDGVYIDWDELIDEEKICNVFMKLYKK